MNKYKKLAEKFIDSEIGTQDHKADDRFAVRKFATWLDSQEKPECKHIENEPISAYCAKCEKFVELSKAKPKIEMLDYGNYKMEEAFKVIGDKVNELVEVVNKLNS